MTVVEASGGVARRSGDSGGGGGEGRPLRYLRSSTVSGKRFQEVVGEAMLRDHRGVAQLTTPVQRIDQSRLGRCKGICNR